MPRAVKLWSSGGGGILKKCEVNTEAFSIRKSRIIEPEAEKNLKFDPGAWGPGRLLF
jgi:hypothetical protein